MTGLKPLRRMLLGSGLLIVTVLWSGAASAAKIACVGDSITYGSGLGNRGSESYPAVLQKLVGDAHTVENFGVSGATLLENGNRPYVKEGRYDASNKFGPDVVIIMLGTNDSKSSNWSKRDEFVPDYLSLIEHYRQLGATVYVAKPPTVFKSGKFGITPKVMVEVTALVVQAAEQAKTHVIDVSAATSGKGDLFPDTVHPNAVGAALIAETVATSLKQHGFDSGTPMGTGGGANTGGAGGAGAAGNANAGGAGGTGGDSAAAGGAATGGAAIGGAAAGGAATGGAPAGGAATGGAVSSLGGGGAANEARGGSPANGGQAQTGTGGMSAAASGGATPSLSAGAAAMAGASATPTQNDGSGATVGSTAEESSCGVSVPSHSSRSHAAWSWLLVGLALLRRRRAN